MRSTASRSCSWVPGVQVRRWRRLEHNRLKERLKAGVSGLAFDDIQLGDVNAAKGVLDDGGYRALGSSDWFGAGYLAIDVERSWPSITKTHRHLVAH